MHPSVQLTPLALSDLEALSEYWQAAHPLHPMTTDMLRARLLAPPGVDPELQIAARDEAGKLLGIGCGVYPVKEEGIGGVRWLGVAPQHRGLGIEPALLEALCAGLASRGAGKVKLFGTPPFYIRPGIDTRDTRMISALLERGWKHEATHFNMTADLTCWEPPPPFALWSADPNGYYVQRARPQDRAAFHDAMTLHWTHTWREEAMQAFENDPITLFLGWRGDEIAGFAACEVSQCIGGFGPTGVMPAHRGTGLGRRLLWACLDDLKTRGRERCEIGWIGPVSFYWRACGALLGPSYWMLEKDL